ncbi:MAG: type II secretion system F family protein [Solirubrobacterales bacterium]
MESLIAVGVFLSVTLLIIGVYLHSTAELRIMRDRMTMIRQGDAVIHLTDGRVRKKKKTLQESLVDITQSFVAKSYVERVEAELAKADIPMRGEEFIALRILITVLAAVLGFLILRNYGAPVVLMIVAWVLPNVLVNSLKSKRLQKIDMQITDAIGVMTNALRAGYSFQQVVELVSREMTGPLAMEFKKTNRDIILGKTSDEALIALSERVESQDLGLLVTAVLIQRQSGGNLAEIIDKIGDTIRERVRMKGEIKTLTAQGRASAMIIGFLPVAIIGILMLISPDYVMVLFQTSTGIAIVAAGVVSELLGVIMINKLIDIEM